MEHVATQNYEKAPINYGSINTVETTPNTSPHPAKACQNPIRILTRSALQSDANTQEYSHQNSPSKPRTPGKSPYFIPFSPAISSKSAPGSRLNLLEHSNHQITSWQAGFTIINLFLGLCLLSYPYALACGSFASLLCFIFISFALCYTGKLIVRCFDILSDDVEQSYPMIGYYSFQNFGYLLISIGIISELLGALCTNTIFLWTNLSYLLTPFGLTQDWIILICSVATLPTCWMLNFSELSINSLLGCICKIFTAIVVFATFFLNLDTVHEHMEQREIKIFPTSIQSFCISIGIYIMSFSGHPCLPSIYRSMKDPKQFETTLNWCFVVMACSYILISVFGYLTFGEDTNVIITGNLLDQNVYLSKTLIILVVAGCYFQVSPLIAVMAEIPENDIFKWHYKSNINIKFRARAFRTGMFLCICVISYICMDKLEFLEAITGSICTMIVSVICPALFYHKLFLSKKSTKKILMPTNGRSSMFVNGCLHQQKNAIGLDIRNDYKDIGLKVVLYLYVIVGTVFGSYMFVTDITNALNQ